MNRCSWILILVAALYLMIAPSQLVFSQEDVGHIETIRGDVYWKQGAKDREVKLNPKEMVGRKLVPGERFRCGRQGSLVLQLNGKRTTINEKMGWFPIPYAEPKGRDFKEGN